MYLLFTGSLVYLYYRVYFGAELLSVPFEYAAIGIGLISFAKIMKGKKIKEYKNDRGRPESINFETDNPIPLNKIRRETS